jgi:hypothetical protein
MKVQLSLRQQYSTRDRDNKDVIVRTIEATREVEIPTDFLPTCFRIGELDFYSDRNHYDVEAQRWVCSVSFSCDRGLHAADAYLEMLIKSKWTILKDEKSIEFLSVSLTRGDAVVLIEAARDGLKARGINVHRLSWNENWTDFDIQSAISTICRTVAEKAN